MYLTCLKVFPGKTWVSFFLSRTQPIALDQRRILELYSEADRVQISLIDTEWGVWTVSPVGSPSALASSTPLSYGLLEEVCVKESSFLTGAGGLQWAFFGFLLFVPHLSNI